MFVQLSLNQILTDQQETVTMIQFKQYDDNYTLVIHDICISTIKSPQSSAAASAAAVKRFIYHVKSVLAKP